MSIRLMSQVWECDLDHGSQSVLLAMADHANDEGMRCFPSKARIAWKTGYSERQVQRIIGGLQEKGLLIVVAEARQHLPTEYRIVLSAASRKAPFRGDKLSSLPDSGETSDAPGETSETARGDIAVSPEPSVEPSLEPSNPLAASQKEKFKCEDCGEEAEKRTHGYYCVECNTLYVGAAS